MPDAVISGCGRYRYTLEWDLQASLPLVERGAARALGLSVLFVMLNPSTADASVDDATIRRCLGFARAWGYSRLLVGNLFALRATQPEALLADEDPVGPDNDEYLFEYLAGRADLTVAAWGSHQAVGARGPAVLARLREGGDVYCLGQTQGGEPRHPLYLPGKLEPQLLR